MKKLTYIILGIWSVIALLPYILFLRKMNLPGRRPLAWCSSVMVASLLLGIAMQILRLPEIL